MRSIRGPVFGVRLVCFPSRIPNSMPKPKSRKLHSIAVKANDSDFFFANIVPLSYLMDRHLYCN